MTTHVLTHASEDVRIRFNPAQERIARRAKRPANRPGRMVVIHKQDADHSADETSIVLRVLQLNDLFRREAVLALAAGAQILRFRGLRILLSPLAQAFISSLSICQSVGAVPVARAVPAFRTPLAPFREGRVRQFLGTDAACEHASSMPRDTSQPCHADVLLELANLGGHDD